jgi:outer membrane protein
MKITAVLAVGFSLCCVNCTSVAADLLSIYGEAQKMDSVYASARSAYEAGLEQVQIGRAGLLPVLNITGNSQINNRDIEFANPSSAIGSGGRTRYNSNTTTVTATQPLFRAQNWVTFVQSKSQASQAEAQFRQATQDLITRVAQAYFDVQVAENTVALAQSQIKAIGEQLAQAKRSFQIGTVTVSDVNDAQGRYDIAVGQEINARTDFEVKRGALQQIIGREPPKLTAFGEHFPLAEPNPANMGIWVTQSLDANALVNAAKAAVEVASYEVDKFRSLHLPTLDAVASYNDQAQGAGPFGGSGIDTKTRYAGVQFTVPLYQGGLVVAQVRQALNNLEKARQDLETARRTATFNAQQAYIGVVNGISQVKAQEAAVASSQKSLESSKLSLLVGIRTQVDVLNAEQQLISSQNNRYQAVYSYALSVLKLKSAAGTLTENDLAYVNQWLSK